MSFHMTNHWKRLGLVSLLVVTGLLIVLVTAPVEATDFRGGDRIVIGADEVVDDDLFATGESVEINGTVKGDLFAIGREVIVNGNVEGSIFLASQNLEVNCEGGSLYAAGYDLSLGSAAKLARNLHFNGFSLTTEAESSIGRSLYANGDQVILNGDVANDAVVNSGAFIYELLRFIPILGWLISAVVILVGLGAIYVALRDTFRPPTEKETLELKPVA